MRRIKSTYPPASPGRARKLPLAARLRIADQNHKRWLADRLRGLTQEAGVGAPSNALTSKAGVPLTSKAGAILTSKAA